MSYIEAIVLGLLQGIAEFLPISSSGHLTLAQNFFKMQTPPIALNLLLHLATLFVILVFFRKKIYSIIKDLDYPYALAVVLSMFPTAAIALVIREFEETFFITALWPAIFLCINGCALFVLASHEKKNPVEEGADETTPSWKQALVIGVFQGFAAFPGLSRSGWTIGAARFAGLAPKVATEFSLIISIPVIAGASLLELRKLEEMPDLGALLLCVAVAGVSGWFAVSLLIKIALRGAWRFWGVYCFLIGAVSLTTAYLL